MAHHGFTRREFLRWAVAATAATEFNRLFIPKLSAAIEQAVKEYPLIWMQTSACSGCSVSVINTIHPSIKNVILDQILPGYQLYLDYHSTLMAATGKLSTDTALETASKYKGKYIYIVEGAIPTQSDGMYGTLGEENGKPVTMLTWVERLAPDAMAILAVGTCAAYGGVAGAKPNPSGARGIGDVLAALKVSTPVINIPGCPCHPDWFIGTVARVLLYGLPKPKEVDEDGRLKIYYGKTVHNRCINRDYLDEGVFASKFGEPGCLLELGCKGPFTNADCPVRQWNSGVNWCISANAPCLGCTEPGFPDAHSPLYQRR
ncbi:MAG TPA: hydrogenase small subunit [Candidatus Bathyarchaeia archaeon]|nr:hydrogenase small subunit [Candidatus Bathyarchaeia archaeon]